MGLAEPPTREISGSYRGAFYKTTSNEAEPIHAEYCHQRLYYRTVP